MGTNLKKWQTRSGLNFVMDEELYYYVASSEKALDKAECHIMAGDALPQIMRFVATLILLFNGKFDFLSIFLTNVCIEVFCSLIWFTLPLYKIPGISLAITLISQTVFRWFLHIIAIVVLSLTVFDDWKIILFSIISSSFADTIGCFVFGYRFSAKRNNDIARYVLK